MNCGSFERLLDRYGRVVSVCYGGGRAGIPARAFLQPVLEQRKNRRQEMPTPLGLARGDRFLYLGEAGVPLDGVKQGFVECGGRRFDVQEAQAVWVGNTVSHWWAVLLPRDGEDEG